MTSLSLLANSGGNFYLQFAFLVFLIVNIVITLTLFVSKSDKVRSLARKSFIYELLSLGALIMVIPFYWMVVTSFKDGTTAAASPPVWTPSRQQITVTHPDTGEPVEVIALETQREVGQEIRVVPESEYTFQEVEESGYTTTREVANEAAIFRIDPVRFETSSVFSFDLKNYRRAWYRPELTSRGQANFFNYFMVSIFTSIFATAGTLITSALAAFAFARLQFFGKTVLFYVVLATMMVPGQVLLIPNFLILSSLGLLDTYAALVVPWLASVFTIFLMRQFFMTIPDDLWDAARIDGASRFRYLWQVVVPLSKPVFITAGIFDFLNNWNSLLWPLIVTSTPTKRTLMVGLQNLNDEAGSEFHILMAASCFAILPIVILFFFLQRFFIEGIARTGLK